jgi:hypothetical protein
MSGLLQTMSENNIDNISNEEQIECAIVENVTNISYNTTYTHILEDFSFDNVPKSIIIDTYKDGRVFSHFIETWLAINYPLHRPKRKMRQTHSKIRWLKALPSVKSTDGLTFSISSFLFEMVKDEIQNSFGLCCLYIQHFPKYIFNDCKIFISSKLTKKKVFQKQNITKYLLKFWIMFFKQTTL